MTQGKADGVLISRRDTLKGAALAGLGVIGAGVLSGCSNTASSSGVGADVFAAVTDTLVRYSTGIDSKDWTLLRGVWTDDVDADYGEGIGHWTSADEITDWMENAHKDMGYTLHRLSNIRIIESEGDSVSTRTYVDAVLYTKEGTLIANAKGYYDDTLVKSGDVYCIKKRVFTSAFQGQDPLDLTFHQELSNVLDIEAITQMKTDYWWYMDSKDWTKWRGVFTDDVKMFYGDAEMYSSADQFVEGNSKQLEGVVTCHQGHQSKIVITGPTTATGIWVLNDYLSWATGRRMKGYGYYFEEYEKGADGKWRIKVLRLNYIHQDIWTESDPNVAYTDQIPNPSDFFPIKG
jgi:3-phenylpropionate/cinnamic acid dioxygenase small subunit